MAFLKLCILLIFTSVHCLAGGAGENAILVVNADSPSSKTIANHYAKLRNIPREQIVYISGVDPKVINVKISDFRANILKPIFSHIDDWKLTGHIDYILYSTGFPTNVNCREDNVEGKKYGKTQNPTLSLTSATFFADAVMKKEMTYMNSGTNYFYNIGKETHAFSSLPGWQKGLKRSKEGVSYYLSFQLGEISQWASTEQQILDYLELAKGADFSQPEGTFYFTQTGDVRSKTRLRQFEPVINVLKELGYAGEIVKARLPSSKEDVLGVTLGAASYNWGGSKSVFMPGAIADNLTSYGGIIKRKSGQTACAKMLNAGAAGACGTVVEPYAIAAKFPHAMMHVHYVKGANLAESMYASVKNPYHLIMLGDALCQPFAKKLEVSVKQQIVTVGDTKKAEFSATANRAVKHYQVFIDGELKETVKNKFLLGANDLTPGEHELRMVAVADDPLETRAGFTKRFFLKKNMPKVQLTTNKTKLSVKDTLSVKVASRNVGEVTVYQNTQVLGKVKNGTIEVTAETLGMGKTELYGMVEKGGKKVRTSAISIEVTAE